VMGAPEATATMSRDHAAVGSSSTSWRPFGRRSGRAGSIARASGHSIASCTGCMR
jgi:hypothetical protein